MNFSVSVLYHCCFYITVMLYMSYFCLSLLFFLPFFFFFFFFLWPGFSEAQKAAWNLAVSANVERTPGGGSHKAVSGNKPKSLWEWGGECPECFALCLLVCLVCFPLTFTLCQRVPHNLEHWSGPRAAEYHELHLNLAFSYCLAPFALPSRC